MIRKRACRPVSHEDKNRQQHICIDPSDDLLIADRALARAFRLSPPRSEQVLHATGAELNHAAAHLTLRKGDKRNWRPTMSDDLTKVASSSVVQTFEPELGRLLQPARFFRHPSDVVRDPTLTLVEKRAVLSSWASDACAIESMPALRQMPGSDSVVRFDDVIDALQALDEKRHRSEQPRDRRFAAAGM
jgi:hypothetical protein